MSDKEDRKYETVADIVAEIRRLNPETFLVSKQFRAPMPNKMRSYADRFEEAHKCEVARLLDDNARLMAALKPVLEIYSSYEDGTPIQLCDGEVSTDSEYGVSVNGKPIDDHTLADCLAAVREAQRIYDNCEKAR